MNNLFGLDKKFSQYKQAKIVALPIPFDKSVSWQKGAAKAPAAIIEASQQVELYDIETNSEVYKQGIFTAPAIKAQSSKQMLAASYQKINSLLRDQKFVVTLGGDHSVAIGAIKAHRDFYGEISVLHLDAHADRRDSYEGNKYSHACVIARVQEFVDNIISVGIRSMDFSESQVTAKNNLFLAEEIYRSCDQDKWVTKVIKKLRSDKVYITLDVDVFDSGLMPSTGTPEPGGLDWYQVLNLLRKLSTAKNIIGFDVVELAPSPANRAPDFLVAKLIYKVLSYIRTNPHCLF